LFEFTDGATIYKSFKDKKHFTDSYPFVPYQFSLFQASIENLSLHAAFEGKNSSVGERSMLGVFQEVAVEIGDREAGQLATFDRMYEGIRKALKAQIQRSVLNAENQLNNDFAKRVLKALLLVKYIKGFNATPRNLRVLLQETFDQNVAKLLKNIEEALSLLEQQTYIQRNGDTYEYLTDEEKDVEEEIKNTEVDSSEVSKTLEDLLFAGIIRENKMRYELTGQDYPFTKKLDEKSVSREYELAVHFITPFSDNADDLTTLKSHSLGLPELMVVLPADSRLMTDLLHYKKTDKYARLNRSSKQSDSVISILDGKSRQNDERFKLIQDRVRDLISKAKFLVAGEAVEISGEDPKTRIVKGFNELVMHTYSNLRMLKSTNFDENDIRKHLDIAKGTLLTDSLTEPENEVLAFIKSNKSVGTRTTMKGIEDNFSKKPYGWYLAAIQCLVAMLLGRGKIEAKVDSNLLDGVVLERALKNTHGFPHIILDPQSDVNPSELRRVKDFYNSFFDKPASANEAKALGLEVRTAFQEMLDSLKILYAQVNQYSFLSALDGPIKTVQEFSGKEYAFYFTELPKRENELLDLKEESIDPIRQFMSGSNKNIFDESNKFLQTQSPNFSAMENDKPAQLKALLDASDCYKGNRMKEAKTLMDGLKKDVEKHVKQVKADALAQVEKLQQRVKDMQEYSVLKKEDKQDIEQSFTALQNYIQNENLISSIRDRAARYQASDYNALLTRVTELTKPDTEKKTVEYVSQGDLGVNIGKNYLADETDVDEYLNAVKKAMLKAIKNNKRIQL
jgi:hypothetical protein